MVTKAERTGAASVAGLKKKLKDAEQHVAALKGQLREAKSAAKRAKKELKRAKRAIKQAANSSVAVKKAVKKRSAKPAPKKSRIAGTPEISTPAVAKQRQRIKRIITKRGTKSPPPTEVVSTAPAPETAEAVTGESEA